MSQRRLQRNLANLGRAVAQLEEAVRIPRDRPLVAEGTVQRFEFVIELFWKTLKRGLEFEGRPTRTPREALTEAYDPALLDQTYDRICGYGREMRRMLTFLEDRFPDTER